MQSHITSAHEFGAKPRKIRDARRNAGRKQKRHANRAAQREERENRNRSERKFLVPRKVILPRRRCGALAWFRKKRGLSKANVQRLLWARTHTIKALHAALVDNHLEVTHLFVHTDV